MILKKTWISVEKKQGIHVALCHSSDFHNVTTLHSGVICVQTVKSGLMCESIAFCGEKKDVNDE